MPSLLIAVWIIRIKLFVFLMKLLDDSVAKIWIKWRYLTGNDRPFAVSHSNNRDHKLKDKTLLDKSNKNNFWINY